MIAKTSYFTTPTMLILNLFLALGCSLLLLNYTKSQTVIIIYRVAVLKQIQNDLSNVAAQSAGPRYNERGEIIPYSLLGNVDDYKKSMIASGKEVCILLILCDLC